MTCFCCVQFSCRVLVQFISKKLVFVETSRCYGWVMVKGDYPWYRLTLFKYNEALSSRKKSIVRQSSIRNNSMSVQKDNLGRSGSSELYAEYFRTGKQLEKDWKTTPIINYTKQKQVGHCSHLATWVRTPEFVFHNTSYARIADLITSCPAIML